MKCLVISGDGAAYLVKNPHNNWKEFAKAADEKWGEGDIYFKEHPDLQSAEADIENLGWDLEEPELVQDGSKLDPIEFGYLFSLDDEDMIHLTESKTFNDLVEASLNEAELTGAQKERIKDLYDRYNLEFSEEVYKNFRPAFDLPDGWVAGSVGGQIYVGISPEGDASS